MGPNGCKRIKRLSDDEMKSSLFVPLTAETFEDFLDDKMYEVRKCTRGYTLKQVCPGRPVELRRGYGLDESIYGRIGQVITGTLDEIFSQVDFKEVEPQAASVQEAMALQLHRLGSAASYIAFEIQDSYATGSRQR